MEGMARAQSFTSILLHALYRHRAPRKTRCWGRCRSVSTIMRGAKKVNSMIEHIVLFRWAEGASREAIDSVGTELRKLKDKIPGIVDLSYGANFCDRSKGYTHG